MAIHASPNRSLWVYEVTPDWMAPLIPEAIPSAMAESGRTPARGPFSFDSASATRVFASIASMSAVETSVATVCCTAGSSARGARVSTNVSVSVMVRSAQRAPTAKGARRLATMMSRAAMIRRAMRTQ